MPASQQVEEAQHVVEADDISLSELEHADHHAPIPTPPAFSELYTLDLD